MYDSAVDFPYAVVQLVLMTNDNDPDFQNELMFKRITNPAHVGRQVYVNLSCPETGYTYFDDTDIVNVDVPLVRATNMTHSYAVGRSGYLYKLDGATATTLWSSRPQLADPTGVDKDDTFPKGRKSALGFFDTGRPVEVDDLLIAYVLRGDDDRLYLATVTMDGVAVEFPEIDEGKTPWFKTTAFIASAVAVVVGGIGLAIGLVLGRRKAASNRSEADFIQLDG